MNINQHNQLVIEIPKKIKDKVQSLFTTPRRKNKIFIDPDVREYLISLYSKYGFKIIARAFNISYTQCRGLYKNQKIKTRIGQNICLESTRKFRSKVVMGEKNPWFDWPGKGRLKNSRGIQGYYTRLDGRKIWLRSTWEYIYAKWLDKQKIQWEYEGNQYKLSNGESYRPDFVLSNTIIVEIKGFFKDRLYKIDLLKKEYPKLEIIVLTDIKNYTTSYHKDLKIWKQMIKHSNP